MEQNEVVYIYMCVCTVLLLVKSCLSCLQHAFWVESWLLPFRLGPWGIPCPLAGVGMADPLGQHRTILFMFVCPAGHASTSFLKWPWGTDLHLSAPSLDFREAWVSLCQREQRYMADERAPLHHSLVPGTPPHWSWGWARQGGGTESSLGFKVFYGHPRNISIVVS